MDQVPSGLLSSITIISYSSFWKIRPRLERQISIFSASL
ncbi:hypothetical protein LEP1GSC061_1352 [Leptospira wolffii serovar Khorat str. Khorat-H2]|nr:hypothetical protein LEP1GSC061_1352 [Leptospira wolffii serovar Khorat str. Khorat-H2]